MSFSSIDSSGRHRDDGKRKQSKLVAKNRINQEQQEERRGGHRDRHEHLREEHRGGGRYEHLRREHRGSIDDADVKRREPNNKRNPALLSDRSFIPAQVATSVYTFCPVCVPDKSRPQSIKFSSFFFMKEVLEYNFCRTVVS